MNSPIVVRVLDEKSPVERYSAHILEVTAVQTVNPGAPLSFEPDTDGFVVSIREDSDRTVPSVIQIPYDDKNVTTKISDCTVSTSLEGATEAATANSRQMSFLTMQSDDTLDTGLPVPDPVQATSGSAQPAVEAWAACDPADLVIPTAPQLNNRESTFDEEALLERISQCIQRVITIELAALQNPSLPSSSSSSPATEPPSNSGNNTTPVLVNDANLTGPLSPPHEAVPSENPQNLESALSAQGTGHQPCCMTGNNNGALVPPLSRTNSWSVSDFITLADLLRHHAKRRARMIQRSDQHLYPGFLEFQQCERNPMAVDPDGTVVHGRLHSSDKHPSGQEMQQPIKTGGGGGDINEPSTYSVPSPKPKNGRCGDPPESRNNFPHTVALDPPVTPSSHPPSSPLQSRSDFAAADSYATGDMQGEVGLSEDNIAERNNLSTSYPKDEESGEISCDMTSTAFIKQGLLRCQGYRNIMAVIADTQSSEMTPVASVPGEKQGPVHYNDDSNDKQKSQPSTVDNCPTATVEAQGSTTSASSLPTTAHNQPIKI